MQVTVRGSGPGATTAGILLLTRARQLGLPLRVQVVGRPDEMVAVRGPAVLYAPVLASCGVGRDHGHGALVVVPGPPRAPLLATASPHGVDGWFEVTRTGEGAHPATRAFVRLSSDPRVPARHLGKQIRRVMSLLGMAPEPAVLDVLFGAQVSPLTRLSLALRAGRAISGGRGEPITRFLSGIASDHDPLPPEFDPKGFLAKLAGGELDWIVDAFSPFLRDEIEGFLDSARRLAEEDGGRDLELTYRLCEMASHLVMLPPHSILPPLGAAEDSLSVGIQDALKADGDGDANQQLVQMFRFLGGTYVSEAEHAHAVVNDPVPSREDTVGLWIWFCAQVRQGRKDADAMWPNIIDPPQ